jgi:hypothetical protein
MLTVVDVLSDVPFGQATAALQQDLLLPLPPSFQACCSSLQSFAIEVIKHHNVGTSVYCFVGFSLRLTLYLNLECETTNSSCSMYGFGDRTCITP